LDTAEGVVPNDCAALVNEPVSTARTNAGRPLKFSADMVTNGNK
jgi:hypothetical protein